MAEMTLEIVRRFLLTEGSIGVVDREGVARLLHPELDPEYLNMAVKADRLWHDKVWFSRQDFLQLCTRVLAQSEDLVTA